MQQSYTLGFLFAGSTEFDKVASIKTCTLRYTMERIYGEFQRSISLPTNIDEDKIEVTFKEEILSVKIPKKNDKNIKKVSINVTQ